MSADEALGRFAARLRGLKQLAPELAKEAAPLVEAAVKATAAAGTTVDGKTWPTKRDGGRALPNAASAVTVAANGAVVIVRLAGAYVFHHRSKGRDQRRILPDAGAGIPKVLTDAIDEAKRRVFARLMR
jgi:hypothetical protein